MGKRKSRKAAQAPTRKVPKLDTTFNCPFCNNERSVSAKLCVAAAAGGGGALEPSGPRGPAGRAGLPAPGSGRGGPSRPDERMSLAPAGPGAPRTLAPLAGEPAADRERVRSGTAGTWT